MGAVLQGTVFSQDRDDLDFEETLRVSDSKALSDDLSVLVREQCEGRWQRG